jgi:hypothetical protein
LVIFGKMPLEVHAVVENASDLDAAAGERSVEEKMPGMADLSASFLSLAPVATQPEVIRACSGGDFGPVMAACALGILGDILDSLC